MHVLSHSSLNVLNFQVPALLCNRNPQANLMYDTHAKSDGLGVQGTM